MICLFVFGNELIEVVCKDLRLALVFLQNESLPPEILLTYYIKLF